MKQETLIAKAGGPEAVRKALSITRAAMHKWRSSGMIPPKRMRWFCERTGKKPGQIAHLFGSAVIPKASRGSAPSKFERAAEAA